MNERNSLGVPAVTDDACLYVLDDEGVFFSRSRREMYVFNTTATFVWCGIESGWSPEWTVQAYVETFDVPVAAAADAVAESLREWWALGYLESPGVPCRSAIALDTALAWLMVNPRLRAAFRHDAAGLAARLHLSGDEFDTFLGIAPDALDRQADVLEDARAITPARSEEPRFVGTTPGAVTTIVETVARTRARGLRDAPILRDYRMLSTHFRVRFSTSAQEARVAPALEHLAVDAATACDIALDVVDTPHGHVVMEGLVPQALCRSLDGVAPVVKSLLRLGAIARADFLMEIHAGVVAIGGYCLLLPGPPGSGKSTLTAGLCHAGFTYFSDEVALLEDDLRLRPVPLGVGIKPGSVAPLSSLWPDVASIAVHDREDGQRVRYLSLPAAHRAAPETRAPARWIVFPRYDPDTPTELRALPRPEALRRLMRECMVLPRSLDESAVARLVRWMRGVTCYELPMSSLSTAVELIRRTCVPD